MICFIFSATSVDSICYCLLCVWFLKAAVYPSLMFRFSLRTLKQNELELNFFNCFFTWELVKHLIQREKDFNLCPSYGA